MWQKSVFCPARRPSRRIDRHCRAIWRKSTHRGHHRGRRRSYDQTAVRGRPRNYRRRARDCCARNLFCRRDRMISGKNMATRAGGRCPINERDICAAGSPSAAACWSPSRPQRPRRQPPSTASPAPIVRPAGDRDVRTRRCVRRRALHGERRRPQLTAWRPPIVLDADRTGISKCT
jgi:hypothetical protein